jgi:hypothetical protein
VVFAGVRVPVQTPTFDVVRGVEVDQRGLNLWEYLKKKMGSVTAGQFDARAKTPYSPNAPDKVVGSIPGVDLPGAHLVLTSDDAAPDDPGPRRAIKKERRKSQAQKVWISFLLDRTLSFPFINRGPGGTNQVTQAIGLTDYGLPERVDAAVNVIDEDLVGIVLKEKGQGHARSTRIGLDVLAANEAVLKHDELDVVGDLALTTRVTEWGWKALPERDSCQLQILARNGDSSVQAR